MSVATSLLFGRSLDADQPKYTPESITNLGNAYLINFTRGNKLFELTNHLGNVMATVSDRTLPEAVTGTPTAVRGYTADIVTASDYYPFGMVSRAFNSPSVNYRYGFNGKEVDNEMFGIGNELDYGMRVYDPRVGRFLSVDPLTKSFPWYTPYQYAGNKPIWATDLDGLEERPTTEGNERTTEFATTSTSADLQSSKGPFKEKVTKQWFWHKGSSEYGTTAGWYDSEEYSKMVRPIANELAGYLGMYGVTAKSSNWNDEQKADVVNTSLGRFFSSGISEEGAKALTAEAYSVGMYWNESSSGRTEFSSINVESVIGVGQLIKGLLPKAIKNSKGVVYPNVTVGGYGKVPFPKGPYTPNNSQILRSEFTPKLKGEFKEWWIQQGRPWPDVPEGSTLNIHHIKPLSKGGTNSFDNLVPLIQPEQHQPFTNWWRAF